MQLRVSRQSRTPIHILDNDSLLHIFYLCRPSVIYGEFGNLWWESCDERWWYKFAQVCRRWRYLILESASYLGLCLLCTSGTPVADMLAHSPPFPLIIDHVHENHNLTTEDEEGIILALQQRDHIYCICFRLPIPSLQKLITAIDGEFPMLPVEYLYIGPPTKHETRLILPRAFEAPHLRHLWLDHFPSQIRSLLLTTATGLVTVVLRWIHPSTYLDPFNLLQPLSLLTQLETLEIGFRSPVPKREIEEHLFHAPIMTHFALSNLRLFVFWGTSTYLEELLPQMITPFLETFTVHFFNQLSFSVPRLLQFMTTTERFQFGSARFVFHHGAVAVFMYTHVGYWLNTFYIDVTCKHLDWQVSSVAQIFNTLNPLFSEVVDLTLDYREHTSSSEWHNQVDCTRWHELLGSFRNVKTLRIQDGLVGELSCSLRMDEELTLGLLPGLRELVCPAGSVNDKTFAAFIHERGVLGKPVNLIRETFPIDPIRYTFVSSNGVSFIEPAPVPPQ